MVDFHCGYFMCRSYCWCRYHFRDADSDGTCGYSNGSFRTFSDLVPWFYQCSFQVEDIQSIGLEKSLPGEHFKRTNGGDTDQQLVGYFEGDKTGAAMMFIHRDVLLIIQIELPDQTVFFNGSTRGLTEAWYAKLKGMYTDY